MIVVDGAEKLAERRAAMVVSRVQLLITLKTLGMITPEEAIAAACTGAMPAAIETAIGSLPYAEEENARIVWAGMTEAHRLHPLVALLAAAQGLTDAQVDEFFAAAAAV